MSRFVVGLDGGGSSTVAWVANQTGQVLGRAEAGPSNVKAVGNAAGLQALTTAIHSAMTEAGVEALEVVCLGLAGFDRPDDRQLLDRWNAERRFANRVILVNDGELVLAAGTPEGWGVAVIAGTGSIVVGRAPDGRSARAGGWGHIFGDEGSGYGTAIDALRHTARKFDGRVAGDWRQDPLSVAVCEAVGVADPSGLVTAIYGPGFDRARIAKLAAVVVQVALSEGAEGPALSILRDAGHRLGETAHAVASRLGLSRGELPLAMAGGFLLSAEAVAETLEGDLQREGYRIRSVRVVEPVQGAIVLAIRALEA